MSISSTEYVRTVSDYRINTEQNANRHVDSVPYLIEICFKICFRIHNITTRKKYSERGSKKSIIHVQNIFHINERIVFQFS